jgi:hypothetical protein
MSIINNRVKHRAIKPVLAVATLLSPIVAFATLGDALNTEHSNSVVPYNVTIELPVYFIGAEANFKKIKATLPRLQQLTQLGAMDQSALTRKSDKVFVIDGTGSVDGETIQTLLTAGYPVISLNNTQSLKKSVNRLAKQELSQKQISGAVAADLEAPAMPAITAVTDSEGKVYHETVYGHYTGENLSTSFTTIETDPAKAIALAQQWAAKAIKNNKANVKAKSNVANALHPVWELEFQRDFSSGDAWSPVGVTYIGTKFYRLGDDGDDAFDWWTVEFETEVIPGTYRYNDWHHYATSKILNSVKGDYVDGRVHLVDYEPSSSTGWCTSSIGGSVSAAGPSIGVPYSCDGESLLNQSDSTYDIASWAHQWNILINFASHSPMVVKPIAQFRVPQGAVQPYLGFKEKNNVSFKAVVGGNFAVEYVTHDVALAWSFGGSTTLTNKGYHSTQINEPSDPYTWNDNYMCASKDIGLEFRNYSPISGKNCMRINEPSDPHTWGDNYLCLPDNSDHELAWAISNNQKNSLIGNGYACVLMNEPSDPHGWEDNYVCYRNKRPQ